MISYIENEERDQDRISTTLNLFRTTGLVLFPENKKSYENIASRVSGKEILEAGCGIGLGAAILERYDSAVLATDKLSLNIKFADALYPWISFDTWDIGASPYKRKHEVVVCVETIEHIKNYKEAAQNLLNSATQEVWITTPNRNDSRLGQDRPINDFHVREFTPKEFIDILGRKAQIYHWYSMEELDENTKVSPLIYCIKL